MARLLAMALLACALSLPQAQLHAQTLYGANGYDGNPSTLYAIDTATGAATAIGAIGYPVTGLAYDAVNGVMYGATSSTAVANGLITIDLTTGAGTPVGSFGLAGTTWMGDITFDAAGNLFGFVEPTSGDLYRINTATGAATQVGDSGLVRTGLLGLDFDTNGTLYLNTIGFLYTVNTTTGAVTPIGTQQARPLALALEFDANNVLYGLEMPGFSETLRNLVRIDVATGNYTVIGATADRMDALAFGPDPGPEPPVIFEMAIDIDPHDSRNKVNLKSRRLKPLVVAALGEDWLDVEDWIIPESAELGDPELVDPDAGIFPVPPTDWQYDDVNGDGCLDLLLRFDLQQMRDDGAIDRLTQHLLLQVETPEGDFLIGVDAVNPPKPPKPPK